ncbi:MAG: sigma-70 family RNA polymerase sigma factor [Pseudomonadota bacterium]
MATLLATIDDLRGPTATLPVDASLAYPQPMTPAPEDSALMLRYCDGDVSAFETLYRRHNDSLYRYLLRLCSDPDAAQDVFQDAWGKIIKSRDRYRPTAKFSTFLFRVAHNCFIDYIRRNKRHTHQDVTEPDEQRHPGDQPEALVEKSLAKERLEVAIRSLPDEQRDVYLLHEEAGFTLDQIATITDSNRETAKSRLRYAVNKLKQALELASEPS